MISYIQEIYLLFQEVCEELEERGGRETHNIVEIAIEFTDEQAPGSLSAWKAGPIKGDWKHGRNNEGVNKWESAVG